MKQIPYHKKPADIAADDWQKTLRKQIAQDSPFEITPHPGEHTVFTQYTVRNPVSKGTYTVAIRSPGRGLIFVPAWISRRTAWEHASISNQSLCIFQKTQHGRDS